MENDQDDDRNIVKKGKRQRRKKQRSGDYVDNDQSSYNYDDEDPYGEDFLRVDNIQFGNYLFLNIFSKCVILLISCS